MPCTRCGAELPADSRYCFDCGSPQDTAGADDVTVVLNPQRTRTLEDTLRVAVAGDYEIHHELGRGGMAAVYLATERMLNRKVAIKVLPPEMTFGRGSERFIREARTAAALEHPNIIPIYRVAGGGDLFWYAMKFVEGSALDAVLKQGGPLPLDRTIMLLRQVASALDYAHGRDVIHRDVKPANVMLEPGDRVLMTDFGIAKAVGEGTLTESGAVLGTPHYMSPEQGLGRELTGRSDQYAVAVMAFQMLAGGVPFDATTPIAVLHKHVSEPPPPLEQVRQDLPRHCSEAVRRGMNKDPEERYPSVTALVDAMAGQRRSGTRVAARGGRRVGWAAVAVLGVTGLVGVGSAILRGSDEASETPPPPAAEVAVPMPVSGWIAFEAIPQGAALRIDGTDAAGPIHEAGPGLHAILIALADQDLRDSVSVAVGETATYRFPGWPTPSRPRVATNPTRRVPPDTTPRSSEALSPQSGVLVLQVEGGWARIFIDGVLRGEDTRFRDTLPAGTHTVRLERPGFVASDTTVDVRASDVTVLRLQMVREPS